MQDHFGTQTAPETLAPPMFADVEQDTQIFSDPNEVSRESPRYLFFVGDIMTPRQKRNNPFLLKRGGDYLGQDYKTLRLTKYCVWKCTITPMVQAYDLLNDDLRGDLSLPISSSFMTGQNLSAGVGAMSLHRVKVYPGDEIRGIIPADGNQKGIVELKKLAELDPLDVEKAGFQSFFFPDWAEIRLGTGKELPTKLDEIQSLIDKQMHSTSDDGIRSVGEDMLISCDQYREWGFDYLKTVRELVKTPTKGGRSLVAPELADMLYEQLGIRRDDLLIKEEDIAEIVAKAQAGSAIDPSDIKALVNVMVQNQEVIKQFMVQNTSKPKDIEIPLVEDDSAAAVATETTIKCGQPTAGGTPCQLVAGENGRCHLPSHQPEAV